MRDALWYTEVGWAMLGRAPPAIPTGAGWTLLDLDDVKEVIGRRELYRRCARTADALEQVAERVWYAVVKSP